MNIASRPYFPNADVKAAYMALSKNDRKRVRETSRDVAREGFDFLDGEPHLYCILPEHVKLVK